jgi:predicted P-loop ATPase/GTPase
MKLAFAIVTTILLLAGHVSAQPAPAGPPPVFKVVNAADKTKGLIEFIETVTRVVPEQREVFKEIVVVKDGVQVKEVVKEKVSVYVPVTEQRIVMIDAAKSRVITPDGKQLPIDEVWKRLKKDTVVLVSSDGNTPAQAYLKALNQETLVVIAPQIDRIVVPPGVTPIEPKKLEPPPAPRGR